MNLIATGGIETKNTLVNTKGAVSLSLTTNYIDGINLNVAYTKDRVFVIADEESILLASQGVGYIRYSTYNDLLHYNFGTKILNAKVVTLNEVLEVYKNTDKILILNLDYQGERTDEYTYQLLELINKYPNINIYLKSDNKQILEILKSNNNKARIGVIINDNNKEELEKEYDFYVINSYDVNKDLILKRINNNRDIMTELIQSQTDLISAYYRYGKYILYKLFIITSAPKEIYDTYLEIKARI